MTPRSIPRYKWILAAGDYACIISSFLLAMMMLPGKIAVLNEQNLLAFALFAVVWVFAMEFNNLYDHSVVMIRSQQSVLLFKSAVIAFMIAVLTEYIFRPDNWFGSRGVNALVYPTGIVLLSVWRMVIFRSLWKNSSMGTRFLKRTAIIGASPRGLSLASRLEQRSDVDLHFVGFIDDAPLAFGESAHAYRILGTKRDIKAVARQHQIHKFVIASDSLAAGEILDLADECTSMGAQVDVAYSTGGILNSRASYSPVAEFEVIHFHGSRYNLGARILKRILDVVAASIGLVMLSPLFAMLGTCVLLSSPGGIFYRSRRIGRYGKPFNFYKFRSMRPAVETSDAQVLKAKYESYISDNQSVGKIINDDRVTRIGKFMRKTSLDELPQLWNVVKGDMSLVGPRPCLPHEYELYSEWHKKRVSVLPGCTGLWQVSDRNATSFSDMVMLDYFYIENMSTLLDIQIILKTFPVMIFGRGDF